MSTIHEGDESPDWFMQSEWHGLTAEQKKNVLEIEAESEITVSDDFQETLYAHGEPNSETELWNVSSMEVLLAQQKTHVEQTLGGTQRTEVIAQTWPDIDQNGNTYVSIDFPDDSAKLIADHPTRP